MFVEVIECEINVGVNGQGTLRVDDAGRRAVLDPEIGKVRYSMASNVLSKQTSSIKLSALYCRSRIIDVLRVV